MDVAERLSDVGIDVKALSSQEEARELVGEDAMMIAVDVRELIEAVNQTKSSLNDNTQPSQSDVTSEAVSSNAVGAATVMRQRTKADIAKISKNTNIAKNYIKKSKICLKRISP